MKIQDLVDIVSICEAGSFRKASQRLGITQPTLSKRIAYLESQLGVQLFDRSHSRARPTVISSFIADRATAVVDQAEGLIKEIYQVAAGRGGLVRIGFGPAPAYTFLAETVQLCRQSSPGLVIETISGGTEQLAGLMLDGKIDLAVCPFDPEHFKKSLDAILLLEGHIVFAARPEHPIFSTPFTNPAMLFTHQLVLPVLEARYRKMSEQLYQVDLDKLNNLVLCSDYSALIKLVLSGDYVTAGPRFAFVEELARGTLKAVVLDERVKYQLHLITNRSKLGFPALDNVIQAIHQSVHSLSQAG